MVADIVFYLPTNVVEVVAHELERVLEQVDGLRLRDLAKVPGSGVTQVGREDYETTRAFEAGRRVSTELERARLLARTEASHAEAVESPSTVP